VAVLLYCCAVDTSHDRPSAAFESRERLLDNGFHSGNFLISQFGEFTGDPGRNSIETVESRLIWEFHVENHPV